MIDIKPTFYLAFLLYTLAGKGDVVTVMYLSALLHEIGHIAVASYFGYRLNKLCVMVRGVCATFKAFKNPPFADETVIALAGPLVNLVIILISTIFIRSWSLCSVIVRVNVYILAINLLPVYPLDGGRVVNAFLGTVLSSEKKHKVVSIISTAVGFLLLITSVVVVLGNADKMGLLIASLYVFLAVGQNPVPEVEKNSLSKLECYFCDKDTLIGEIVLKTGINENILILVKGDDGLLNRYITGDMLRNAAMENGYFKKACLLAQDFTYGGNKNGNGNA